MRQLTLNQIRPSKGCKPYRASQKHSTSFRGVSNTSKEAYKTHSEATLQRQMVLSAIQNLHEPNFTDISYFTGIQKTSITPRVDELRRLGRVVEGGKKLDIRTNKTTLYWVEADKR